MEVAEKGLAFGELGTAWTDENAATILGWHVEHVACVVIRNFMGLVGDGVRGHEIEVSRGKNALVSQFLEIDGAAIRKGELELDDLQQDFLKGALRAGKDIVWV